MGGSLIGRLTRDGLAQPDDEKTAAPCAALLDELEPASPEAVSDPPAPHAAAAARSLAADDEESSTGSQDPRRLLDREAPGALDDQVEVVVGEGEPAGVADLEGDPALGVEADPRRRPPDIVLGGVDAPHPGARELTGKEEGTLALAAFDLEHAFGLRRAGVHHRRRQGDHRIDFSHRSIIPGSPTPIL
jgi:hypothetical protein